MKFDNEFEVEGIKKLIDIVILELIDIEIKWVYNDIYDGQIKQCRIDLWEFLIDVSFCRIQVCLYRQGSRINVVIF